MEDLIARVAGSQSRSEPVDIRRGYEIVESWNYCTDLTFDLANPYIQRGWRLRKITDVERSPSSDHAFLGLKPGELIVIDGFAGYVKEVPVDPRAEAAAIFSTGAVVGRGWTRVEPGELVTLEAVEAGAHVVCRLRSDMDRVLRGKTACEILEEFRRNGPEAVVTRYFI